MPITVRLTAAQRSALECAGLESIEAESDVLAVLARSWDGVSRLSFDEAERIDVFEAITERANAEDGQAEDGSEDPDVRRMARGACVALTNLANKILRT